MKHGKLILAATAFIITAASALAFRTAKNGRLRLHGTKSGGSCFKVSCWTKASGTSATSCALTTSTHQAATGIYTDASCVNAYTGIYTKQN